MKQRLFLILCLLAFGAMSARAQDPQLSQFYAAPLYLNPAFTGNLDYECRNFTPSRFRGIVNYRNQYRGEFQTMMASLDYRNRSGSWGFGGLVYQDYAGSPQIATFQIAGLASYKVELGRNWNVHSGLQLAYGSRGPRSYTYPDQFNESGLVRNTNEPIDQINTKGYPTTAIGVLAFNDAYYGGLSIRHLNQPNQSIIGAVDRLPMHISLHTGYRINLTRERFGFARLVRDRSVIPAVHYRRQGNFQQLDVGSYLNYEPIVFGVWYRGLPLLRAPDSTRQNDALVVMLGIKQPTDFGLFKLGFSFDVPISYHTQASGRTFEVSLSYQRINARCRKKVSYQTIPCPGL